MDSEILDKVDQIIQDIGKAENHAIPILQSIQDEFNYLPQDALKRVSETTDISASKITGISTFYSQFRHSPVGEHIIKVCIGTACHVKGAMQVHDAFKRSLKIEGKDDTDADKLFTVEKVACLGCCTIAPVVQIDDVTYGHVTTEKVDDIIKDFKSKEKKLAVKEPVIANANHKLQGEIRIGLGSCCVASGSREVKEALESTLESSQINVDVKHVGCVGICNQVPMLEVHKPNEKPTYYTKIKPEEVSQVIHHHFKPETLVEKVKAGLLSVFEDYVVHDLPKSIKRYKGDALNTPIAEFLDGQMNIATEFRGELKPSELDEYINLGGFDPFKKCLKEFSQQQIIDTITQSALQGRGGGGFKSGIKWQMVKDAQSDEKYVICNGDEGDPGAFMDRMLLESYPFRVIEGLLIAGLAVGATKGFFYIRAEYPLAVERIKEGIAICREKGYIGKHIFDSKFSFDIEVFEGAGAFVCGEETALIASIEGNRGIPIMRPPYPAEKGLWGKPTLINNTETLSLVSWIIKNGAEAFANVGTKASKGTKVFALAGKINRGGLIEVPMGITIRTIIDKIGGGIPNGKKFKAVQIGGPSGGCIPSNLMDTSIDFDSLKEVGAMMGSGGLIVLDETDCMVDIARYFLAFTQDQSCGRCTFCRVGTKRMLQILDKISAGKGVMSDLETLEKLAYQTKKGSICGLGKTAPNPVLSTLKYFREEYLQHINGKCPTGKCLDIIKYSVNDECIGCTKCAQRCPVDAIESKPYELHSIDTEKCVKCDICRQICPVDAVVIE
ncbi:MAG: NAD(P)H-dependent oxidoreductase subunit E [Salinivirgaceae bacterium]|jgi:NADH-quinone oxidoreductase subunit F|nr:NAD(P)H-dependent oxidoreductase subunit E [Salinivirgaceae bacterium]